MTQFYLSSFNLFFFNLFEAHQALPRLFYWLLAVPTIAALFGFARYVLRLRRLARLQQAFLIGGLVALGTLMVPQFLYEGVIYHNAYHGRRLLELLPFAPAFFLLGLKEATDFLKSNWGVNWDWSAYFVYLLFLAINAYYYFS